jgi:hypothetical protein
MKRALLLAGALTLVLVLAATAVAATKVYYETPYGKVAYKPKRIDFSDATYTRIHWKHWNSKVARGKGRARINTCDPNCAAGAIVHGTAKLAMFKRHTENGKRFYGCLTGRTRVNGHVYRVEWPPACNH